MNTRCLLATALAGLLAAALVFAEKQQPPAGGAPKDFQLPARNTFQLENGLGATLIPYGTLPKASVTVLIRSGNFNEAPNEVWLADIANALMEEGTTTRKADALASEFAAMGGGLEIEAGADQTSASSEGLGEFADEIVRLLADVVRNPAFPESEVARLQNDFVRNLSIQLSQPQPLAESRFAALLYPDHPYGRMFPTEEMIRGYTAERIRKFYEANFGAQRAHVYVAGVFNAPDVEKAIRESFGDWQKGPEPAVNPPKMQTKRVVHLIHRPDAPQSTLRIGLPVIDPSNKDYLALQVTNTLLGGSFGSRITSNIRENKGYTYSPNSAVQSRYRAAHWVQSADVTTKDTAAAMREIFKEIQRLQNEPPPAEELQGIQNYLAGIFVLQNSSRSGLIERLSFIRLHGLPETYLTEYVKNVYAITPADVQRIAKQYLQDQNMTIVVVGDRSQVRSQLSGFGQLAE